MTQFNKSQTSYQFFVTGTDTEIGKTTIAAAILRAAGEKGLASLGLKPIAAGCEEYDGQWKNEDALALMSAATVKLDYDQINPIALRSPIAPHLAAKEENKILDAAEIVSQIKNTTFLSIDDNPNQSIADVTLVEGAGGWLVPLNERETFADIAAGLDFPVILVVGIRLGCINHALLTANAIEQAGLTLAGWVANCVDPNAQKVEENIETLKQRLYAPCLGVVPFFVDESQGSIVDRAMSCLKLDELIFNE